MEKKKGKVRFLNRAFEKLHFTLKKELIIFNINLGNDHLETQLRNQFHYQKGI